MFEVDNLEQPNFMSGRKRNQSQSIKLAIQAAGLRATPARIATLNLLHDATAPLTHAEVADHLADIGVDQLLADLLQSNGHAEVADVVQELGIDKATVFRNLNDLAAAGLLRRTELGDRVWRFELVSDDEQHGTAHPHFVCIDCGVVSCMDEVKLTAGSMKLSRQFGPWTAS